MHRTSQSWEAMKKIAWVQCDRCEASVHWSCFNLRKEDVEDAMFFCVLILLFLNHLIGFCKSRPIFLFMYIYIKPTQNVFSVYKLYELEIKTHLLKGTNISSLLSCVEKASESMRNICTFLQMRFYFQSMYIYRR